MLTRLALHLALWLFRYSKVATPAIPPGHVPREAHDLVVATLTQQALTLQKLLDETTRRLLEVCEPGSNARLIPVERKVRTPKPPDEPELRV